MTSWPRSCGCAARNKPNNKFSAKFKKTEKYFHKEMIKVAL